jgi:predicted nucleic acid-binding protein
LSEKVVVDASVAIKWLVPEQNWAVARRLLETHALIAPQLILAECSNILWKKLRRGELTRSEVVTAAEKIVGLEVGLESLQDLMAPATELSVYLDHPAYDCFYLALALVENSPLVTADERLLRVLDQRADRSLLNLCQSLHELDL